MSEEQTQISNQDQQTRAQEAFAAIDGIVKVDDLKQEFIDNSDNTTQQTVVEEPTTVSAEPPSSVADTMRHLPGSVSHQDELNAGSDDSSSVSPTPEQDSVPDSLPSDDSGEAQGSQSHTIESPIFGDKKKTVGSNEQVDSAPIESLDQMNEALRETTGYESFNDFKASFPELKQKAEKAESLQVQVDQVNDVFQKMPESLYKATQRFAKGDENWAEEITNASTIDFKKDSSEISKKEMIEAFFPGQFSDDDWSDFTDADGDDKIKGQIDRAHQLAVTQFDAKKEAIKAETDRLFQQNEQKQKNYIASVDASITNLRSSIPEIDDNYVGSIKKELSINQVLSLFFNQDGTLKEDAAERYVMSRDGKGLMSQYKTIAEHQAENKERQEVLQRGADKPKESRGGSAGTPGQEAIRPEVTQHIDAILGGTAPKNTY